VCRALIWGILIFCARSQSLVISVRFRQYGVVFTTVIPASTPMEFVLLALGGCSGADVVSILNKKRFH